MTLLQKIVNLALLIFASVLFYDAYSGFSKEMKMRKEVVEIVETVSTGEPFEDMELARVANAIMKFAINNDYNNPICLLKAYEELVIQDKVDTKGIWDLIPSGKEFRGVHTCWDYYSLLYYRAGVSDNPQKEKAMTLLNQLMQATIIKRDTQCLPICIYFYAFGSELTTKQQLTQILAQNYKEFVVYVQVDASNDNTHMYAKYVAEQQTARKVDVHNQKERQGFMGNLAATVDQCPDNSLVLLLDRDSTMISPQSLNIFESHFATNFSTADVAVFKSLTKRHENIEPNTADWGAKSYPVIAFRKSSFPKIKPLVAKIQEKSEFLDYQHQLFSLALLKSQALKVSFSNNVILSRNERSKAEEQRLSELLLLWQ